MTSATLIYSPPHLNEIPPKKTGVTGPSYTTPVTRVSPLPREAIFKPTSPSQLSPRKMREDF